MPRYVKKNEDPIETSDPAEGAWLHNHGYAEQKARSQETREADEAKQVEALANKK